MQRFIPKRNGTDEGWFRVGAVDVTTTILLTGLCVISFFVWAANPAWLRPLVLYSYNVRHGQVWRVATWPVANEPSLWAVVTLAVFYFFGRELERLLGRNRFAWFLGIIAVASGIVATAFDFDVAGLRFLEIAVFLVFVMLYPNTRGFFGIPLWIMGAVFLAITVLQYVGYRAWTDLLFLAIILGIALLTMRAFGLGDDYAWIPKIPLPQFITGDPYQKANRAREKQQRKQSKGSGGSGGGLRRHKDPAPVIPIRPEARLDRADQADMDWLLDKISASGMDSLTPDERRRLDEHSRRLRGQ